MPRPRGTAELGHGAAYYWKGKVPTAQFFTSVLFGLSAIEMNARLSKGEGQKFWDEAYAPFGVKPMVVGNTGMQMGGWYNKEINSLGDLRGLKIRMPGLGGEVLARLGATTVNLPGGEVFTALQTGAIDATDWVSPYNDRFRPAQGREVLLPAGRSRRRCWNCWSTRRRSIPPPDLQAILTEATRAASRDMMDDYVYNNALDQLKQQGVEPRASPTKCWTPCRSSRSWCSASWPRRAS